MRSACRKLSGYQFYEEVLHSPKFIVAPMVDQSELAWRILSRRHGAQLVYTPMINAKLFVNFNMFEGEEGGPEDRPLIVQFCANDPEILLAAAKQVEAHCNAVDINLGCPQDIARRGKYGAFLQDDWDLVYKLINILHVNLNIPVTAKFRVFPTVEKTVAYAKMMESAGAQILTCHGRLREQRGHNSGLADWNKIRAVKEAVSVPVFANGNILYQSDISRCLDFTGADGLMSAEGNLYNPALFDTRVPNPPHTDLALEYLDIVKSLKTPTSPGAIKGHLFKLFRPALDRNKDLRDRLGKTHGKPGDVLVEYEAVAKEMKERMERDSADASDSGSFTPEILPNGRQEIPHWRAQPYFRPGPPPKSDSAIAATSTNGVQQLKNDLDGQEKKRGATGIVSDGEDGTKRQRV
ncbi:hypothetical protein BS47DRAFT_1371873 [Hydnum rufescens UP504]|uniref:tRNA-dihydrouridine(16/17) synthase [NAD(P)(+)] n=1 Tax=Hydnum rufescens UP504 TaxID=1448309 RepID=A0A9P6B4B8_9AGAM|nr:hypothetical protein BS47DRAFT_1371873 [Hydnum rufescens UP504]